MSKSKRDPTAESPQETSGPLYLETSALLRILLEGDDDLSQVIASGRQLITSRLTVVETDRGIRRAYANKRLTGLSHRNVRRKFTAIIESCEIIEFHPVVITDAQTEFPVEPVRTLDALHLASFHFWARSVGRVTLVSYDIRVRQNVEAWGYEVVPPRCGA